MITIDYRDKRPIYEQIVDKVRLLILRGVLKKDDAMPSVRSLALELSINPNTIQKAYQELERMGYIYSVRGRGSFIGDSQIVMEEAVEEVKSDIEALILKAKDAGIGLKRLLVMVEQTGKEKEAGTHDRGEGNQ